ncbi:SGNH/GDSL hydrolase family protein [Allokutzneria sp. A3M-2-11 16]|uniref:SGNH/GDSL hydrolase family protein n=1 Tax=Allokutzneria sp. A3M-2-11 16 TaxID=2962043 RepID=UPI0020B7B305|nr:SGNH/GDSL hydrolase family protein [Allokutzneria sp. A3M-2-11 16]MCP3799364.1 SGNH/GDSL hydrolase family protein [Allokutzneria sp. A3M-2-11 16]
MKKSTFTAAVLAAAFTACGLGAAASATPAAPLNVVALGDSTASGTGAGLYHRGTHHTCWRSSNSYSEVAVAKLRAAGRTVEFRNATCSGAGINEMRTTFKSQPAQLDALKPNTNVVLLTVGANDIKYVEFGGLCMQGDCSKAGKSVTDQLPAMSKNLLGLFGEIKAKSPKAKVVLVGYGRQLTAGANGAAAADPICAPTVFSAEERAEGNKVVSALDMTLRVTAKAAGATFVSPYVDSVNLGKEFAGHSQCESGAPYYRGFDALAPNEEGQEAVLHLNKDGQAALGELVTAQLR